MLHTYQERLPSLLSWQILLLDGDGEAEEEVGRVVPQPLKLGEQPSQARPKHVLQ
jgi:hypothetical protein